MRPNQLFISLLDDPILFTSRLVLSGNGTIYGRLGDLSSTSLITRSLIATTASNIISFKASAPYDISLTSDGGITHTSLGPTFSGAIDTVAWNGSIMSICSSTNSWYSSNMTTWTQSATVSNSLSGFHRACWGPSHSMFVYCCTNGGLGYSLDNGDYIRFSVAYSIGGSGQYWNDIIWVPQWSRYIVVSSVFSYYGSTIRYSTDGINWTLSNNNGSFQTRHNFVAYSPTLNIILAMGRDISISTDGGSNWDTYTNPISNLNTSGISMLRWLDDEEVFLISNSVVGVPNFWTSRDGQTWIYHSNKPGSTVGGGYSAIYN